MGAECNRCGHYDRNNFESKYCPNCGANKANNGNIIDMPVIREHAPLAPIVMGQDEGPFTNTHIESKLVTVNTEVEGKLLAILPPDLHDAGWTLVLRVNSGRQLEELRNKLAEVGQHLKEERKAVQSLQKCIDELEKKLELMEERLTGEREERSKVEIRYSEEMALRRKLEADIAKIRLTIGNKQMEEIFSS